MHVRRRLYAGFACDEIVASLVRVVGTAGANFLPDCSPNARFLAPGRPDLFQGGTVGTQPVSQENLAFMVHSPPKVVLPTVDLPETFVQITSPAAGFHSLDPPFSDLGRDHWPKPKPSISNHFMADVDTAVMQQILNFSK